MIKLNSRRSTVKLGTICMMNFVKIDITKLNVCSNLLGKNDTDYNQRN